MVSYEHDEEARILEEVLRSAHKKAVWYREAVENRPSGPGSRAKEFEALRKALAVVIRASGPFIV